MINFKHNKVVLDSVKPRMVLANYVYAPYSLQWCPQTNRKHWSFPEDTSIFIKLSGPGVTVIGLKKLLNFVQSGCFIRVLLASSSHTKVLQTAGKLHKLLLSLGILCLEARCVMGCDCNSSDGNVHETLNHLSRSIVVFLLLNCSCCMHTVLQKHHLVVLGCTTLKGGCNRLGCLS